MPARLARHQTLTAANLSANLPRQTDGETMADDASWTIKSVPIETRQKAIKAAAFRGLTVGKWLIQAVDRQANIEQANEVIPPGKPDRAPAVTMPDFDPDAFAAALSATVAACREAGHAPPRSLALNASATMNRYMRAARGLGQTRRQTRPLNGQTIEGLMLEGQRHE
jgi:hypothetical protein